jgi:hypothetical protein
MLKLGEIKNFTVVSFTSAAVCGGVFDLRSGRWHLRRVAERKLAGAKEPSALWRELWSELHGGGDLVILTGTVPGGVFFSFETLRLAPREQREALLLELPRQMLTPPDDPVFQYLPVGDGGSEDMELLNVYSFERKALDAVTALLRRARLRADELIHPLLTVRPDDPPVFLSALDRDFYFSGGKFHRTRGDDPADAAVAEWKKILEKQFAFDSEIADFGEFLPVLLCARFIAADGFNRHRRELQLMPKELHPVRYRRQLRLTAILGAALLLTMLWSCGRERWRDFSSYREVVAKTEELKRKNDQMQSALRRGGKEQKEIAKVINANFGESDVLGQLADISRLLPQDVMVTDFRWSETGIDIVLQSESENLDLPGVLKPLTRWKVADIHQRQGRFSTTTTVTAKLVPVDQSSGGTKNGRKNKNTKGGKR